MERKCRFEIFENLGIPREVVLFLSIRHWKMQKFNPKWLGEIECAHFRS